MSNHIEKIKNEKHIGKMFIDGTITFDLLYDRKELLSLGDVVYFMISDNQVVKVGKAGGIHGFYSRMSQYKNGVDETNNRIIREAKNNNITEVDIYIIECPREETTKKCILTDAEISIEMPSNVGLEKYYMRLLGDYDEDLFFCNQLNKEGK